jgi:hypothetical protein
MNAKQISKLLRMKCKDSFLGVFARDRLPTTLPPRRPLLLVCNTDPHDMPGRHWIAMYVSTGISEYFDSYGEPPLPIFERFLNKFGNRWIANEKKLQGILSSYCGHYCVFYALFKQLGYDLRSITNCFIVQDSGVNDFLVHRFVCNMIE